MKHKIALITYHSAYNFGSMLQALATQIVIDKIAGNCKIINYRLHSQRLMYSYAYIDNTTKPYAEYSKQRLLREDRFENFMNLFNLTEECDNYTIALNQLNEFDILISGSDQIWNKNTGELISLSYDYMRPYLLDVLNKFKISYASSICDMSQQQIDDIGKYFSSFTNISVREGSAIELIGKYYKKDISSVCDPTLLLTKKQWVKKLRLKKNNKKFILYYTLWSYDHVLPRIKHLLNLTNDMDVHVVAPFCNKPLKGVNPRIIDCVDYGPKEFMNDLYNAQSVIAESYHGAILSALFNKTFICPIFDVPSENRKIEALTKLGLKDKITYDFFKIDAININEKIDYNEINKNIRFFRKQSYQYLKHSIRNAEYNLFLKKNKKFFVLLLKLTPRFIKEKIKKVIKFSSK